MGLFSARNKEASKQGKAPHVKQKRVACPYCDTEQAVALEAKSVFCRKCHKRIGFEDHKFNSKKRIGDIVTRGTVDVGKKGDVQGNVVASDITIRGKFTGKAEASGSIRLFPSATFIGELKAPHLIISEGATFVGESDVQVESDSKKK